MVTKSITSTPFGVKYIYSIQGEEVFSEYLAPSRSPSVASPPRTAGLYLTESFSYAMNQLSRLTR